MKMHGKSRTPEYRAWQDMKRRCKSHPDYAGRGISVDSAWESFEQFLSDMGERPGEGYSLGRVNNQRGYSKDNCRWENWGQQLSNTRSNVMIEIWGIKRCLAEWCRYFELDYNTARQQIFYSGASVSEVLGQPEAKIIEKV